jgi:hypothetical protein
VSTTRCRLVPLIFFPRVVSAGSCRSRGFHRLTVDDPGAGFFVPPRPVANVPPQRIVDLLPNSLASPLMEVVADGSLGRKIVWQRRPRAAARQHVENPIEDFPQVRRPWSSGARWAGQQWGYDPPLFVRQVTRIGLPRRGGFHASYLPKKTTLKATYACGVFPISENLSRSLNLPRPFLEGNGTTRSQASR